MRSRKAIATSNTMNPATQLNTFIAGLYRLYLKDVSRSVPHLDIPVQNKTCIDILNQLTDE